MGAKPRPWRSCLGAVLILSVLTVAGKAQETVIVAAKAGECELYVEADERWHTLRLRPFHPGYKSCRIDREEMVSALRAVFSGAEGPLPQGVYTSLFIGRAVQYPWISRYLVEAARLDRAWDIRKAKPLGKEINKYVSSLLSREELTGPIEAVLEEGGYRIAGVSVEKVLVGGSADIPGYAGQPFSGRLPFDAQVWFLLEKK